MNPHKTLIVVRHGHAIEGQDDFARTLSTRGIHEVHTSGAALRTRGVHVEHVLTSAAPRAATTAVELAPFFGFKGEVEYSRALYLANARTLLDAVTRVDDRVATLLLVGHNPGLSTFVEQLTGERTELATAEWRILELDAESWSVVTFGLGRVLR